MILFIECLILILLFTFLVYILAKNPITTLYNYPPKIQEKVKSMKEYKDKIPTRKNMFTAKIAVCLVIISLVSLIFRYINGYTTFKECFYSSLLIWTIINIYDVVVLDIMWFCQSEKFIFKGTENLKKEYQNYKYHIIQGLIGQVIGTAICLLIALVVQYIL